jgi:hypothetical protein
MRWANTNLKVSVALTGSLIPKVSRNLEALPAAAATPALTSVAPRMSVMNLLARGGEGTLLLRVAGRDLPSPASSRSAWRCFCPSG